MLLWTCSSRRLEGPFASRISAISRPASSERPLLQKYTRCSVSSAGSSARLQATTPRGPKALSEALNCTSFLPSSARHTVSITRSASASIRPAMMSSMSATVSDSSWPSASASTAADWSPKLLVDSRTSVMEVLPSNTGWSSSRARAGSVTISRSPRMSSNVVPTAGGAGAGTGAGVPPAAATRWARWAWAASFASAASSSRKDCSICAPASAAAPAGSAPRKVVSHSMKVSSVLVTALSEILETKEGAAGWDSTSSYVSECARSDISSTCAAPLVLAARAAAAGAAGAAGVGGAPGSSTPRRRR